MKKENKLKAATRFPKAEGQLETSANPPARDLLKGNFQWEAIISASPDGLGILSPDGKLQFISEKLAEMYGYSIGEKDEYLGTSFFDVIDASCHQTLIENTRKLTSGEDVSKLREYLAIKKDKSRFYVEISSSVLRDDEGSPLAIYFIQRDITERKAAENKVRESESKYRMLFKNMQEGFSLHEIITDENGHPVDFRFLDANPAYDTHTGLKPEGCIGKTIRSIFPQSDSLQIEKYGRVALSGEPTTFEYYSNTFHRYLRVKAFCPQPGQFATVFEDITLIKQAEQKLQESESRYRSMIAGISDVIGIMGADGLIKYKSPNIEKWFGWKPEDLIGSSGFVNIHPDDLAEGQKVFQALFEPGSQAITIESRYRCKNGSYKPIELTANNLLDDPLINGILLNYRDISERKKTETMLFESQQRYLTLAEWSPYSIVVHKDMKILYVNQAAVEMFGATSAKDLIGTYIHSRLHPDFHQTVEERIHRAIEDGISAPQIELKYFRLDGTLFTAEVQGIPIVYDGEVCIMAALRDITDRKNLEAELERVSARLTLATSAGSVGVWEYDAANNHLFWDDQMFAHFGIEKSDFGSAFEALRASVHPDDFKRGEMEIGMALRGEKVFDTVYRVEWPDGSIHFNTSMAVVNRDESGRATGLTGANLDVTEVKKAEALLIKDKTEAIAASRFKSAFLANMSHEIRTPLNAVIGFSQLLNHEKTLTGSQKEYVTSINRAGEHLLKLINDVLELSKIEAGRALLKPTNFDLHALLNDMQMMFSERAQSKQLQLVFEISGNLPRFVIADEHKLRQILINLIGNALKFTGEGHVAVRARGVKVNEGTSRLIAEIEDSGPGISEHEMGKLFNQFEQTASGINSNSGTGLGLALSRELAMLMGGNITVASHEGKGSVFTINVEIAEGKPEAGEAATSKRVLCIVNPRDAYRVLVVDDKEENRQVAVNFLRLVGFETLEAVNGLEAIAKFEQGNPHLVLMDMRMPVMDGYEATRRIKSTEKGRQTPIIALTASMLDDEKQKTTGLEIQGYIHKPFRESEFFDVIGKALGIGYIYEEETMDEPSSRYLNNHGAIEKEISRLPEHLVLQMREAVVSADFHLLVKHIESVENEYPELSRHLMAQANNYNYAYLLKVFTKGDSP